jgi:UTP--glucose-1-phosphate uridylyltransferase
LRYDGKQQLSAKQLNPMPEVTKAIIPAAGLGTRFLPQTKAMPKEMLPIIDKPVIQYIVEEAVAAGITEVIIVTGAHKRAIEDHFDHQVGLQQELRAKGKDEKADQLEYIADMANFVYVRQKRRTRERNAGFECVSFDRRGGAVSSAVRR